VDADTPWQTLIDEAQAIPPGAQGVKMQCDLLASQHAGWQGVTLNTTRGHFYRAALEGLSDQLAQHLQTLENIGRFRAQELLLVGGGSRNALWNQIKANRLGYRSKFSMMPKPRWPARRCLAGMAWASSLPGTGQSAGRVPLPLFLAAN
jgi:sugar (pentulose or hexulose) kinase